MRAVGIKCRRPFLSKNRIKEEYSMLNRTVMMGRLTADPDYRTTPGGVAVANIRMAVERDHLDLQILVIY